MDEDVRDIVKKWTAPPPSPEFERTMLERFRRRQSLWKRLVQARVQLPVPVLAASILMFTLAILFAWTSGHRRVDPGDWQPVADPKLRVIRAEGVR